MKVVALSGGTGSAKLLRGLARLEVDLTVIANVGDDFWFGGLMVCPDLDVSAYALAGVGDERKGWGLNGDSFRAVGRLRELGGEGWFRLGDRDLATCLLRTALLREGRSLTEATAAVCRGLGVKQRVLPLTDDDVQTFVLTPQGRMHLQEFWVREKGTPAVTGVEYAGAALARTTPEVVDALKAADRIVVSPANPVTSVGPMLAVPGFGDLLGSMKRKVSALSPMVGDAPFSGPAGKMMTALGIAPDSVGVARRYMGFVGSMLISSKDARMAEEIRGLGIRCRAVDTAIVSQRGAEELSKDLLAA